MENRDYKVNIKNIYVGDVCGIDPKKIQTRQQGIYMIWPGYEKRFREYHSNQTFLLDKPNNQVYYDTGLNHCNTNFYRSMLFTLDEKKRANDLLNNSPHYPIFNVSSNSDCLESSICVCHDTFELYNLLKYFNYPDKIGYEDILRIRKELFSVDFVLDNCELFGRKDTGEGTGYHTYDSSGRHRSFNAEKEDSIFSENYFRMLWNHRDGIGISLNGEKNLYDHFTPCEEEGPIKSLDTIK